MSEKMRILISRSWIMLLYIVTIMAITHVNTYAAAFYPLIPSTKLSPSSCTKTIAHYYGKRKERRQQRQHHQQQRLQLAIGPILDVTNIISLVGAAPNEIVQTTKAVAASTPLIQASLDQLILYTAYASTSSTALLKPATGHSQPLWGPPDPYLSAGRSIPPSPEGLADMGVVSVPTSDLTEPVRAAANAGYNVLDTTAIKAQNLLPGFSPIGGILPSHNPRIPDETPGTFAVQVEWAAKFLNVVDKLPEAAFLYALIEFFILRPGIDLYKEDIELQQERGSRGILTAETLAVTGVRIGVFFVIAVVTNVFFG